MPHLLSHCLTGVENPHDCAEGLCSADRSKTCDASSDDENLCGRHTSSSSDLSAEEPTEMVPSFNDCPVACNVGLGTQGVKGLSS